MAKAGKDLEGKLDALYAAPLDEFVAVRNTLAKSLDASGEKEEAARVKALRKPSAAAWAVNQLAFAEPKLLAALVASGERMRKSPSDLRAAMAERRERLNDALRAAERALAGAGRAANADALRRISATLEAIATYGGAEGAPVAGRLTEDVPAPGFDEIASLGLLGAGGTRPRPAPVRAAPPTKAPSKEREAPTPKPSARDVARERRAEEALRRETAARLAAAKRTARTAQARLEAAEKKLADVRRRKAAFEARLSGAIDEEIRLHAEAEEARAEVHRAEAAAREVRPLPGK